ncbi:hypothetical protein BKA62DRAFT_765719 [Auriculariales sp. MPI-PUGE-AT-0066]|nr:hypothetical protein BKA62DRAFT_765719 [Auriculariales sp. MPI-PUGE-AT-0066]
MASLVALTDLHSASDGDKVRLVARTTAFDAVAQILTVADGPATLAIDVSGVLDPHLSAPYLRPKSTVMIMGRLERTPSVILRAILIKHVDENGFEQLWKQSLEARKPPSTT